VAATCVGMIARSRGGGDGAKDGERGHDGDHGQASCRGTGARITGVVSGRARQRRGWTGAGNVRANVGRGHGAHLWTPSLQSYRVVVDTLVLSET
jgi:hypothetical protein